jgi:DNA-binding NarL/FixJ family response regulator
MNSCKITANNINLAQAVKMIRILIVDDHLIMRQGLKQSVESTSESVIVAETCSGQEAINLVQRNTPDVVLVGVILSTIDPIELLKQIKADKHMLPVLVFSSLDEEQYYGRLLRAGASGILTKDSATSELVEAITKVASGRKYISPSLAERLTDLPVGESTSLHDALSDREYEVMVSIASGKRIKQIADEMSLSIKTVSTYHSRILLKLKLDNDAQLIRYAIEQGIIRDNIITREKLIMTELNIRTAPVIRTIREIWHQRKAVIIIVGIVAIITYIVLTYLIRFVF